MTKNFSYGLDSSFVSQSIENLNARKPFIKENGRLSFEDKDRKGMQLVQFLLKPLSKLDLIKIKREQDLVLIKYQPDVRVSFKLLEYPSLIGDGSVCPVEVIKDHQSSSTFNILYPALKLRTVEKRVEASYLIYGEALASASTTLSPTRELIPFISTAA